MTTADRDFLARRLADIAMVCALAGFGSLVGQPWLAAAFALGLAWRGLVR